LDIWNTDLGTSAIEKFISFYLSKYLHFLLGGHSPLWPPERPVAWVGEALPSVSKMDKALAGWGQNAFSRQAPLPNNRGAFFLRHQLASDANAPVRLAQSGVAHFFSMAGATYGRRIPLQTCDSEPCLSDGLK
jgi:hypothetical protein